MQQRRAKLAEIEKRKKWSENKRKRKRAKKTKNGVANGAAKEEKDEDSDDSIEDGSEFVEDISNGNGLSLKQQRSDPTIKRKGTGRSDTLQVQRHRRTQSNISDAVIQSLVANSSQTLIRLQSRSKQQRYKMNIY